MQLETKSGVYFTAVLTSGGFKQLAFHTAKLLQQLTRISALRSATNKGRGTLYFECMAATPTLFTVITSRITARTSAILSNISVN